MSMARTRSVALEGTRGHLVEIEVDISAGLPKVILVGLPDTSLGEARDRCRAAVVNSRRSWPDRKVTIGLSPAALPKFGSHYDLGIAVAVLAASGEVPREALQGTLFIGELALDGRLRAVPVCSRRRWRPPTPAAIASSFRRRTRRRPSWWAISR